MHKQLINSIDFIRILIQRQWCARIYKTYLFCYSSICNNNNNNNIVSFKLKAFDSSRAISINYLKTKLQGELKRTNKLFSCYRFCSY